MKIFKKLLSLYNNYMENKRNKKNTLLDAEKAYTLYAINEETTFDFVYDRYKQEVLSDIKYKAKNSKNEMYISHPEWVMSDHKAKLYQELKSLGYNVLYTSEISMIISWNKC